MLAIIIGLLICLGVALVIVLAVAMPHLREGETLLTEEGQDVLRRVRTERAGERFRDRAASSGARPAGSFSSVTGLPVVGRDPLTGEDPATGERPEDAAGPAGDVVRHPAGGGLPGHAVVDLSAEDTADEPAPPDRPRTLTPPARRHNDPGRYSPVPRNRHGNPLKQG